MHLFSHLKIAMRQINKIEICLLKYAQSIREENIKTLRKKLKQFN